jgi:hypothetical protein
MDARLHGQEVQMIERLGALSKAKIWESEGKGNLPDGNQGSLPREESMTGG